MELEEDFHADLPDVNLDKLMAAIDIVSSDKFYKDLPIFIELCNVLAGAEFDPTVFDPADVYEIAWGITEALLISPIETDEEGFNDEIRFYIGHMVREAGIINPPDVLAVGLFDKDRDPISEFADDPGMYKAMYDLQQSKTEEVTGMLQENLRDLFVELESLQLENGSTEELLKRVRKSDL